jgi:hypothetical protein
MGHCTVNPHDENNLNKDANSMHGAASGAVSQQLEVDDILIERMLLKRREMVLRVFR